MKVEYFFDFSCPFAYLGATQIERVCARAGADVVWRPMALEGVFRDLGPAKTPPPVLRTAHERTDARRWAELYGVPLRYAHGHPFRTGPALHALLATEKRLWSPVIAAIFESYWGQGADIAENAVLSAALDSAGLDRAAREKALAAHDDPAIDTELSRRTDEALSRGVFDAPTMFVHPRGGGEPLMVFGQDRLKLVAAMLAGWHPESGEPPGAFATAAAAAVMEVAPGPASSSGYPVELWYDIASPYSYLAATGIEAVCERVGSPLLWRPMLLGAVFKALGGPLVPVLSVSEPKRRYLARDLAQSAAYLGVPFQFSSRFPLHTITALRLLKLAGDRVASLTHALFDEAWVHDRNVSDPEVLSQALSAAGLDGDLLAKTSEQAVKDALFEATAEATRKGVFGAPTFIVKQPEGDLLFWGHDRMDMVARAATGWRPSAG